MRRLGFGGQEDGFGGWGEGIDGLEMRLMGGAQEDGALWEAIDESIHYILCVAR